MNDTSKSFARETLDEVRAKLTDYVTYDEYCNYADYAALSAQLEAANARAARARDDALGEAAGCIGHITRHEDLDAIFALRTQPTPSVEPVTAPTNAQIMADPRVRALVEAGNWLSVCAQTTGGVAGHDADLVAAITGWTSALAQLKEPKP